MKNTWVAVLVLVAVFAYGTANAKRVAVIDQNRIFIVTETQDLLNIPDVPVGLDDVNIVDKLVSGELSEYKIEDKTGKWKHTFKFPWVWSKAVYTDVIVSYKNGHWVPNPLPARATQNEKSMTGTISMVLIPLLGIVLVSIACPLCDGSMKAPMFFYLAVFIGMGCGMLDPALGFFVGFVMCAIAGTFCAWGNVFVTLVAAIAGMFAGLVGVLFNENIQPYALFLLGTEVNSFILAIGIAEIMKIRRTSYI